MSAHAVIFQEQVRIPMGITTLAKFRQWARTEEFPERGVAYIGGNIEVDMSPEELTHNKAKAAIHIGLGNMVESESLGDLFVDGVLLTNAFADLSTVPDLVFVSYESLESGKVKYIQSTVGSDRYIEVEGSPDVVIEVISESSLRKDTVLLRERYWKAEASEYWLADARSSDVGLQILRRGEGEEWETPRDPGGWQLSGVFSRKFRLNRVRDRLGSYRYRLESRTAK